MLPRENRLDLARQSHKLRDRGRSLETPYFRLNYLPALTPRFGFIITAKIGLAHERNRARRMLREVVRSRLSSAPPIEAVFIARRRLVGAKYEDILSSFDQVLSKISLPR